ncbi:MAG: twin transmembrane helix small protein [Caulobacteraceae bacterium]|nr:twin transmembrane helix small protein [Caulobacteraceae bacterium]
MRDVFHVLLPLCLIAVTVSLCLGFYALFRGGDFGRSYSNKLMRLRVLLQFVTIMVLVAAFWWGSHTR